MARDILEEKLDSSNNVAISEQKETKADINDIVKQVFSTDSRNAKSILNQEQIASVAAAYAFANLYDDDDIKLLIHDLLELQISFAGTGRKNLTTILSTLLHKEQDIEEQDKSLKRKLFGF
jgi:hypothetical protein